MSSPARNVESSKLLFQPGKERSGSRSGSQRGPSPFKRPTFQDEQRISQSTKNPLINKETKNIFYKTRLCKKKMQGNCPKGEKCTFAHGLEELHDPPSNWEELVHAKSKRALDNYPKTPCGLENTRMGKTVLTYMKVQKKLRWQGPLPIN